MATTKTYEIRPATRADLPTIQGLYNWAVNQTFATIDSEPLDTEEAEAWWQTHASRNIVLVAAEADGVIGFARLLPWKQRGFDVVEDLVYVDPVYQGRGVGRELLGRLIEEAAGHATWRTIVATVATDNRPGLKLHQSMGFTPVGTIVNGAYKFDRWMDITLLQRPLH
jgi:L-amino acid N-acyltransferase YncA